MPDELLNPAPRRYSVGTLFSNSAFWLGAIAGRDPSDIAAINRLRAIANDLQTGRKLSEIPEFSQWLAYDRKTRQGSN